MKTKKNEEKKEEFSVEENETRKRKDKVFCK